MITNSSPNQKFDQTNPKNVDSASSGEVEGLHRKLEKLKAMVTQQSQLSVSHQIGEFYYSFGVQVPSQDITGC